MLGRSLTLIDKLYTVIGIGPGDPRQVTVEAIEALNRVDVFFVLEKGSLKRDMVALRLEILRRYIKDRPYRVVEAPSPPRTLAPRSQLSRIQTRDARRQGCTVGGLQIGLFGRVHRAPAKAEQPAGPCSGSG